MITRETVSDDSLPDLVSDDTGEDYGFVVLNTLPSTEERETEEEKSTSESTGEDSDKKNQRIYEEIDRRDEEILMKDLAIEQILDMEDGMLRTPIPLSGLTCSLTGEQYNIDP